MYLGNFIIEVSSSKGWCIYSTDKYFLTKKMFIFDELNLTSISVTVCQQGADITVDQSKPGWL